LKSTRTPRYQELIERLKTARKAAKLTQQELADRLKKPQSYVSKYENAERRLDIAEFLEIAAALGLQADTMMQAQPTPRTRRSKR
jgi:transcriptional regulator with XRE-family HTH domain